MSRSKVLRESAERKSQEVDRLIQAHFDTVRQANGQPLNDKRNGVATLAKWERQNQAIKSAMDSLEKTKLAIEVAERREEEIESVNASLPGYVHEMLDLGKIRQWGRHPNTFFVDGVEKGRIVIKDGKIFHRYLNEVPKDQYPKFRDTVNELLAKKREFENQDRQPLL